MVVLRIFSMLLALGLSTQTWAAIEVGGKIVEAYRSPGVTTQNNVTDYTEFQCAADGSGSPLTDFGCVDNAGELCSSAANSDGSVHAGTPADPFSNQFNICDVQRVPAGRCSAGDALACIFPSGAGFCSPDAGTTYDDTLIGCLPDVGTTTGPAAVCAAGTGICDMSTNVPACACTSDDPLAATWEGTICGSDPQARCSDGDTGRDVGGFAGALCTSIDTSLSPPDPSGGRCGDSNAFPGLASSPSYGVENVAKRATLQRRPGTSLSLPTTPIRRVDVTAHWSFDQYEDPNIAHADFNIRQVSMLGNTYFQDAAWGSAKANAARLDNSIITHLCDPPQPWKTNEPLEGHCAAVTTTECQTDEDCAGADICDDASKVYCWESGRDVDGLIWTRDLTTSEISAAGKTGICPPDCAIDNNFNAFQLKAIVDAGSGGLDPRAGMQLALDNGSGPKAGKGDMIFVFALSSMTWLRPDNRCYMGGDPDVVDPITAPHCSAGTCNSTTFSCSVDTDCEFAIGRCEDDDDACNPAATDEPCGAGIVCRTCGGTYDGTNGAYVGGYQDTTNGNATALHIGYEDPTGKLPLHTVADTDGTRIGVTADLDTNVKVPIFSVFTTGKSGSENRDNTCDPGARDHCLQGEVISGGANGISTGGSFTTADTPTYDPLGGAFTALSTWAVDTPGTETPGENTFLRIFDRSAGPDGVLGCLGDNFPLGGPCDLLLGGTVDGSTGSDDVALVGDFSAAQDGSDLSVAAFARFKIKDPTRDTPIFNAIASIAFRDESIVFAKNLDFINKTNSTWCPLDNLGELDCDRDAEVFCSEHGGDAIVVDGICDDVGDSDGDGLVETADNCALTANPLQEVSTQPGLVGTPCACLCGDVNNNCVVNVFDVDDIQAGILPELNVPAFPSCVSGNTGLCGSPGFTIEVRGCDINGDGACNIFDASDLQLDLGAIVTGIFPTANGYDPTNCAQSDPNPITPF